MKFKDVFSDKKANLIADKIAIGIDIGSRQSKAVLLADGEVYTSIIPTVFFMLEIGNTLVSDLLKQSGHKISDISYIVSTGYGRISLDFGEIHHETVTEISCHGLGAAYLGEDIRTIIDIGGQDSKAIKIDPETGRVLDFAMNDKCAAGTGRFLEKVAQILELSLDEFGEYATRSEKPLEISSQCVVFAESEVISLKAKGYSKEDIAAGIHFATARRIKNLLRRIGIVPTVLFTGGVSNKLLIYTQIMSKALRQMFLREKEMLYGRED